MYFRVNHVFAASELDVFLLLYFTLLNLYKFTARNLSQEIIEYYNLFKFI